MSSIDIILVLDASGSMSGLIADTVGGVNHFLDAQRNEPGDAYITLVTFDNVFQERFAAKRLPDVAPITKDTYYGGHGGGTALLDAVGKSITRYEALPIKADKTIFVITTDGQENSSREFQLPAVKTLIEKHQAAGWAFVFLGANDSAWQGEQMGTQTVGVYTASSAGTRAAYDNLVNNTAMVRASAGPAAQSVSTMNWNTGDGEDEK